jgi:hypothetical protein
MRVEKHFRYRASCVLRDQGPLAGVKPSHLAGEAHTLDRLGLILLWRFADDEHRRLVVAGHAVEASRARHGYGESTGSLRE